MSDQAVGSRTRRRDAGSILPLVLVIVVVLGAVVVATATYASSTLKYGQVVESRTDRLSAAEGGMRDVVERIDHGQFPFCTTANGATGTTVQLPDLSGAAVEVSCEQVTSSLSDTAGWSAVVTGLRKTLVGGVPTIGAVPDSEGLTTQEADTKEFGGRAFIAHTDLLGLKKDLLIKQGDLYFTETGCEEAGEYVGPGFNDTDPGDGAEVTFDSSIRGLWCTEHEWSHFFSEPAAVDPGSLPVRVNSPYHPTTQPNGAYNDISGCRVFYPGAYNFAPNWNSYNYMQSGDYVFNVPGTGAIQIANSTVTAGREGLDDTAQAITNAPCDDVRDADVPEGATLYLRGNTHIEIRQNASFEIMRREHGVDRVSIHTLPDHNLIWPTPVLSSKSGNHSQMAIHGLIWAPHALVELGNVTNAVVAQITGSAVVGALHVDASGSAVGLVIGVGGAPGSDRVALTSTATTPDGVATRVRVIAQIRVSAQSLSHTVWEIAQNSWRVCEMSGC